MYKLKKSELALPFVAVAWHPVKFLQIFWKTKVDLNKITIQPLIAHHGESLSERR